MRRYVELTEREASLVLSNWSPLYGGWGGRPTKTPTTWAADLLSPGKARGFCLAIRSLHHVGPMSDEENARLVDETAACIRVVRR